VNENLKRVSKQKVGKEKCVIMMEIIKKNCQHCSSVRVFVSESNFSRRGYEDFKGIQKAGIPIEILPDNFVSHWSLRLIAKIIESQSQQGTYVYLPGDEISRGLVKFLETLGYNIGVYYWCPEDSCSGYKTIRIFQNDVTEKKFKEVYSFDAPDISFLKRTY